MTHSQFCELRAHVGQLHGERLLRLVELTGLLEQSYALGVTRGELLATVRHGPVAGGLADRRHVSLPRSTKQGPGKRVRRAEPASKARPTAPLRP